MLRTRKKRPKKREGEQKPIIVHTKRTQVVDEDGWTHVIDKPQRESKTKAKRELHAGDFEINGVSYVEKTVEELQRDFAFWSKQWKESAACTELQTLLSEKRAASQAVDNAVVLGLGSLQSARREGRRSSATQLAAMQTLIDILGGSGNVILQDPQYTETDERFLESIGYRVVTDPQAFQLINGSTMVFAVHCYKEVYAAIAAREERPAVFIGTNVGNFGRFDISDATSTIVEALEQLVEGCETLDFPQIPGRHDFSDTIIHWRKRVASTQPPADFVVEDTSSSVVKDSIGQAEVMAEAVLSHDRANTMHESVTKSDATVARNEP